jgi:hypothetical protein
MAVIGPPQNNVVVPENLKKNMYSVFTKKSRSSAKALVS